MARGIAGWQVPATLARAASPTRSGGGRRRLILIHREMHRCRSTRGGGGGGKHGELPVNLRGCRGEKDSLAARHHHGLPRHCRPLSGRPHRLAWRCDGCIWQQASCEGFISIGACSRHAVESRASRHGRVRSKPAYLVARLHRDACQTRVNRASSDAASRS